MRLHPSPLRPLPSSTVRLAARARRGAALIIVLGLLAVLMLMAMAFAIAMRTERGGASNQRHAAIARQMLDATLARAMADLDGMLGVDPTPAWAVRASTNAVGTPANNPHQPAGVLSYEVARHLPPDQLLVAQGANPGWLPVMSGLAGGAADAVAGRYAYVVLNNCGLLDANAAGATNRFKGLSAREVALWAQGGGLSGFANQADATAFAERRRTSHGAYKSMGEFLRLVPRKRFDGSDNPAGAVDYTFPTGATAGFSTNHFVVVPSAFAIDTLQPHAPEVPGGHGRRPPKFTIATNAAMAQLRAHFELAFRDAFAADAGFPRSQRIASGAGGLLPYSELAAAALMDYLDDDFLPGRNKSGNYYANVWARNDAAGGQNRTPTTEAVPMLSAIRIRLKDGRWATAGSPTNEVRFTIEPESLYLNWTIPTTVAGRSFSIRFGISDAFWTDASAATPAMQNGLAEWVAAMEMLKDEEFGHVPAVADGGDRIRQREPPYLDGNIPLRFNAPAGSLQPEIAFIAMLYANVSLGDTIQELNELPVKVTLKTNEIDKESIVGWAYAIDPRFAAIPELWITSQEIRQDAKPEMRKLLDYVETTIVHENQEDCINPVFYYILRYGTPGLIGEIDYLNEWPDTFHSESQVAGGRAFWSDSPYPAALAMVRDGHPESLGELGFLPIAPLRTISLYDYRFQNRDVPRHRVLDYFTLHPARAPEATVAGRSAHRAALLDSRVNLNPPFATRRTGPAKLQVAADRPNLGPLTAVFADMPLNEITPTPGPGNVNRKHLAWSQARALAEAFTNNLLRAQDVPAGGRNRAGVVFDLSVLGRQSGNPNLSWNRLMATFPPDKRPNCDFEREGAIRNSVGLLTTRQQIFTIILRADAFTPKFGYSDAGQGTTLSTAHAIAQVWRDPEPLRDAAGDVIFAVPTNDAGQPETTHQRPIHPWVLLYLHQF